MAVMIILSSVVVIIFFILQLPNEVKKVFIPQISEDTFIRDCSEDNFILHQLPKWVKIDFILQASG